MHGRKQREEGKSDRWKNRRRWREIFQRWNRVQHMRSVPASVTSTTTRTVPNGDSAIVSISSDSFSKDGRTLSVGDCALFKPPQDSPPFIGIIRNLLYSKEKSLQLRVNWLYRPAELKLGKGILLDAAPNEIFYSFHKDEIPAASLLHPCRVAFLPKGVELPLGISSFVCRRVYDIESKCLWWLTDREYLTKKKKTDRDYINEQQVEVDQLLNKTKIEMHATVQPGGRSPKPINGPTSTSQLRSGSDSVQNMSSFPPQVKGKKRERGDQVSDSVKRERSGKSDDGDSGQSRIENSLKSEIAKFTEKGRLVDFEGVEKLVHLMQPDKTEKKMDLICRTMLASVVASTDKFDCLNRFVQLRGLPVLDEWLQDIHKGKIGDGSSSKDGDKSVENFLLVLLRGLDKLPVNLHALQMCNIGRSVNTLSKHKNLEIQKKAKSLVDMWKKRVEVEMNVIDSKSGSNQTVSWSSKSRLPESPNGGNRNFVGSGDVASRSSLTQLCASKASLTKGSPGEMAKSASSSPGPVKSTSPVSVKEHQRAVTVGGGSNLQAHNYGQSFSGKDDAKSCTAGSLTASKVSSGGSRHRKSLNGFSAASVSGTQKETSSSRSSSLQRISASEKLSHCGLTAEKAVDVPVLEESSHKLIVKIPNRGRSPAHSTSAGSFEDPSIMSSRASSPVLSDKHDQFDRDLKDRNDAYRANAKSDVNAELWQGNDIKDVSTRSNDGSSWPAGLAEQERVRTDEDVQKLAEVSKVSASSSGIELKSGRLHAASFSSINALIDSCVKDSEANTSTAAVDDVGMNLLASVAAGEMSKSELVSSKDSPIRSNPAAEEPFIGDDAMSKASSGENHVQDGCQSISEAHDEGEKHVISASAVIPKDELHHALRASPETTRDRKASSTSSEEMFGAERTKCSNSSNMDLHSTADECMESNGKLDKMKGVSCLPPGSITEKEKKSEPLHDEKEKKSELLHDEKEKKSELLHDEKDNLTDVDGVSDAKLGGSMLASEMDLKDVKQTDGVMSLNRSTEDESGNNVSKVSVSPSVLVNVVVLPSPVLGEELAADNGDELKVGEANKEGSQVLSESERQRHVKDIGEKNLLAPDLVGTNQKRACVESSDENKVVLENQPCILLKNDTTAHIAQDVQKYVGLGESKPLVAKREEFTSPLEDASSSCVVARDTDSKVKFDLNEGFIADDMKCEDQVNVCSPACPSNTQVVHLLPFTSASVSTSPPAPVTVAAAAKGPFVPPEDLLKSKGELGWKGSAATSAFRPAEPRKVFQMPLAAISIPPPDSPKCKQRRAPLDIDLNVPDERVLEDLASRDSVNESGYLPYSRSSHDISRNELNGFAIGRNSGGLDLDLNRTDEPCDMVFYPANSSCRPEPSIMSVKSLTSGGLPTSEVRMDFDLNNGPSIDDASTEQPPFDQHARGSMHTQPPVAGLRISNAEMGNLSSWFPPPENSYSMAIPTIVPDRMQHPFSIIPPGAPQRILGPVGSAPFTPDMYRGSVLSSSPAVQFPSGPFQYPVYPFGNNFPMPPVSFPVGSTSYIDSSSGGRLFTPPVNSQFLGPVDVVSSHYPRPYLVNLAECSNVSNAENSRKLARQGFDLNAGPGAIEVEGREEISTMSSNQPARASSQSLAVEQGRIYPMGGGVQKRKEPDGGWDNDSFRHKQPSRQ